MISDVLPFHPGRLHLIVAAQQAQGRVVPDPAQVVFRFPCNAFPECVRQLVDITGKHQVLPDHQAHLIAQVKKVVAWIDSAAPDPDRIEMAVFAVPQQTRRFLFAHAGQQAVLRNIVAAHGEEFHAVAAQREGFAALIRFPGDRHRPQAQAQDSFIFRRASAAGGGLQDVQRLLSQSVRPPQPRMLCIQPECFTGNSPARRDGSAFRIRQLQRHLLRAALHTDLQRNPFRFMDLMNPDFFQPGVVTFNEYLPPDAGVRKPGAPVPAEHVMRFSQRAGPQQFTSAGISHIGVFLRGFFHRIHGG